ncbi:MAG: hypothetical protein ACFFCS_08570 [Candidatus Hodarchaeota archaeon]
MVVIGFRIPYNELLGWEAFYRENNLSLKELILHSVKAYINPERHWNDVMKFKEFKVPKFSKELRNNKNERRYISLRVPGDVLEEWDRFCDLTFCSRTNLVRKSVDFFLFPGKYTLKLNGREYFQIVSILKNLFKKIGIIDGSSLKNIFSIVEPIQLSLLLDYLQDKAIIEKKLVRFGPMVDAFTYIAYNRDQLTSFRLIIDNLWQLLILIEKSPEELDIQDINSLLTIIPKILLNSKEYLKNEEILNDLSKIFNYLKCNDILGDES